MFNTYSKRHISARLCMLNFRSCKLLDHLRSRSNNLRLQGKHEEEARNLIGALSFALLNNAEIRKNKDWSESLTEACEELSEFGDVSNDYEQDEYTNASDFYRNWISSEASVIFP